MLTPLRKMLSTVSDIKLIRTGFTLDVSQSEHAGTSRLKQIGNGVSLELCKLNFLEESSNQICKVELETGFNPFSLTLTLGSVSDIKLIRTDAKPDLRLAKK